jgi:hypothetical protein
LLEVFDDGQALDVDDRRGRRSADAGRQRCRGLGVRGVAFHGDRLFVLLLTGKSQKQARNDPVTALHFTPP